MAKRQEEAPVKTDGWKDTFSDLMNLLLCFFVLLFASSTVNEEKLQEIAASLQQSFSIFKGGQVGITEGVLISSGASQLTELSTDYSELGKNEEGESDTITYALLELEQEQLKESANMAEDISEFFDDNSVSNSIEVQATTHYVQLTMNGAMLFDSAKADLKQDSMELLDVVAEVLKSYENNLVEIIGHTDNVPIVDPLFTSNDLLSDYRALAVFEYLVNECGLSPINLKHSGRGEYNPVADNSTEEGRAQNRRVEIKIYNNLSSFE